jgi:hypothetical protein
VPERVVQTTLLAAGLAFGCALIHLQAAADHLDESRLYAVLFVGLGAFQAGWGVVMMRRPSRAAIWTGVASSVLVIAAWVASRTVGLPLGPDTAGPEAAGVLDVLATLDEAVIVALLLAALGPPRARTAWVLQALGLLLVLFSSLVLAAGLHAH